MTHSKTVTFCQIRPDNRETSAKLVTSTQASTGLEFS